jgi:Mrp family chromosome partitioning ATPase
LDCVYDERWRVDLVVIDLPSMAGHYIVLVGRSTNDAGRSMTSYVMGPLKNNRVVVDHERLLRGLKKCGEIIPFHCGLRIRYMSAEGVGGELRT